MNMKIKRLQGGGTASPFMSYTPQVGASGETAAAAQQGQKQEASDSLFSKEMIKLMMDDALSSDLEHFFKSVEGFQGSLMGASGIEGLMSSPNGFSIVIQQLNRMKNNKEKYKGIQTALYGNGGFYEPAITINGGLLARTEDGKTKEISLKEYYEDPSAFRLMTNNELMSARENDVRLGFDQNSLDTLQNGTGFKAITDKIQDVMDKLKYKETTREEYLSEEDRQALRGLQALAAGGVGPDGKPLTDEEKAYYGEQAGIGNETRSADGTIKASTKTKQGDLNSAFKYIMGSLSDAEKTLLAAKAIQSGEKDVNTGMVNMITYYMNSSYGPEFSRSYTGGTASTSSLNGNKDQSSEVTFKMNIIRDRYPHVRERINTGGNITMVTDFNVFPKPQDTNGKVLEAGTSLSKVYDEAFGGIVDTGDVYIGDKRVDAGMLDRIAYTGEKGAVVRLPYIDIDGHKVPDFKAMARMSEAEHEIERDGIELESQKEGIYEKYGVYQYMTENSNNNRIFADFVQLPVYTPSQGIIDGSSEFVTELSGQEETAAERLLKKAYTGKADGKLDYQASIMRWENDIYKTSAFVSLNRDIAGAAVGDKEVTTKKHDIYSAKQSQADLETKRRQSNPTLNADLTIKAK